MSTTSTNPAPAFDEQTHCSKCGDEIETVSGIGWVDVLSGDDGGTYDICTEGGKHTAHPAPATDANGKDIWNLWASSPYNRRTVTVTTDSFANRSAIGNFLLDEGYTVYTD